MMSTINAEAQARMEDEIVQLVSEKQGLTEQRRSDQAQILHLQQLVTQLQQSMAAIRSQPPAFLQPQPINQPAFPPFSPGFSPGFPQGAPFGSMQLPNPLAQQWSYTAPQPQVYGSVQQPAPRFAGGPDITRLATPLFGATNPSLVEETNRRLTAVQRLQSAREGIGGPIGSVCPMSPPPKQALHSTLLKEVADAAKAHIAQFKLVRTEAELMAAFREVLLKVKSRWPRVILLESFKGAALDNVINSVIAGYQGIRAEDYSEPDSLQATCDREHGFG